MHWQPSSHVCFSLFGVPILQYIVSAKQPHLTDTLSTKPKYNVCRVQIWMSVHIYCMHHGVI